MRSQRSPNRWSCLPTSFAMVLDVAVEALIIQLGHDGSQILWPDLPEPYRRRGFHIQEMIDFSWHLGYTVTQFEALPVSQGRADVQPIAIPMRWAPSERLKSVMSVCNGVITGETLRGQPHAVAWDKNSCLDPNGETYNLEQFRLQCFWAIKSS